LAAVRAGDTFVVTKLDRLARSLPDARQIIDELTKAGVTLSLGGQRHDPSDPVGRLLFNVLAMVAEFESDLIRLRTREGMAVARANGHLHGRPPKLTGKQEAHLAELFASGQHSTRELAELFGVTRSTVYRAVARRPPTPRRPDHRLTDGVSHRRDPAASHRRTVPVAAASREPDAIRERQLPHGPGGPRCSDRGSSTG
jgi:hypothetical protein